MRLQPVPSCLLVLLIAVSLPGGAYHIEPVATTADADDPYKWAAGAAGILDGGQADSASCERSPDGIAPGSSGAGILCFMSAGSSGFPCAFEGRSNGYYNAYDGGACRQASTPQPMIAAVARNWIQLQMQDAAGSDVPFVGSIARFTCASWAVDFVYDEQFAYTVSSGHVAGVPDAQAGAAGFGTYTVSAYAGDPTTDPGLEHCGYPFLVGTAMGSTTPPPPPPPPRSVENYDFGSVVIEKSVGAAPAATYRPSGCTVVASSSTSLTISCTPPTTASCTAPCTPPEWACHDIAVYADATAGSVTGRSACSGGPTATATSSGGWASSGLLAGSWRFPWTCEAAFSASSSSGSVVCYEPDPPLPWVPTMLEGLP